MRVHENSIKKLESRTGNLIGVYGPLYAIKKECYTDIPDGIILDDLYLTLNILKTKKVVFLDSAIVYDDNLDTLYDYKRVKRYLSGFFQILQQKGLIKGLSGRQKLMLFWHKYIRVVIPLILLCSYVILGMKAFSDIVFLYIFLGITSLSFLFFIPLNLHPFSQVKSLIRFASFYSIALIELFVKGFIFRWSFYRSSNK